MSNRQLNIILVLMMLGILIGAGVILFKTPLGDHTVNQPKKVDHGVTIQCPQVDNPLCLNGTDCC